MLAELKFFGGSLYRGVGFGSGHRIGMPRVQVVGSTPPGSVINLDDPAKIPAQLGGGPFYYFVNVSGANVGLNDPLAGVIATLTNNQVTKLWRASSNGQAVWAARAPKAVATGRTFGSNSTPARANPIGYVPPGLVADADAGPTTADDCDPGLQVCTAVTLYAFVHPGAGGAVQTTDLTALFGAGAAGLGPTGRVWRLIEIGGAVTYASGTVDTAGTLGGCTLGTVVGANKFDCTTKAFTSDYTHAGFMQLQIGCPGPAWPTSSA